MTQSPVTREVEMARRAADSEHHHDSDPGRENAIEPVSVLGLSL